MCMSAYVWMHAYVCIHDLSLGNGKLTKLEDQSTTGKKKRGGINNRTMSEHNVEIICSYQVKLSFHKYFRKSFRVQRYQLHKGSRQTISG